MPGAEGATCDLNDATNYMVIPCGGASKYEPTVSNVIVWASRKINTFNKVSGEHGDIVPEYEKKVLSFYFRFSIQDANRSAQKYIIFRFVADLNEDYDWIGRDQVQLNPNEKHKTLFSAAAWLKLKKGHVPGATDPLLTDVIARDCNENLETNEPHVPNTQQWFIQRFSNDINRDLRETQLGYKQHWFYFIHKYAGCTAKFFGGRCSYTKCDVTHTPSERRPVASLGQIPSWHSAATIKCPGCPQIVGPWECVDEFADPPKKINNNETIFPDCLEGYNMTMIRSGCVSNITKEGALAANITSIRRPRGNHTTIIGDGLKINISSDQNKINTRGIRGVGFGTMLYSIRKGHGVLMVVVSMFFVPVLCFTSRYFKETFMNSRILLARVWLQLHVQSVFWIVAFYFGGMLLAFAGRALLGVSLHLAGIAHRVLGWVTLAVFIIIAATGPFRLIDDPGRSWTIGIHWVLGYVFYLLNIVTIITSVQIPGSPISDHDESIINDRDEFTVYKAYVILGLWLIIELVLGVIMTIHIHTHDHSMQVEGPRKYFPPFIGAAIPVLRENSHVDAAVCVFNLFYAFMKKSKRQCFHIVLTYPNLLEGFHLPTFNFLDLYWFGTIGSDRNEWRNHCQ
ncbi:unnamed protein product [Orchesella dallaii]|uniref:Ferric-chelate reductase 1 n=1 Tax=Orchesella dallaii TaxID=48710 RepID=A0ABP1RDV7_9HEXA